jgi:hypothetical protein
MKRLNLTGKFGRWTVISEAKTIEGQTWFECQCECGTKREVRGSILKGRASLSCGCLQKDVMQKMKETHGKSYSQIHNAWCAIKTRCNNTKNPNYQRYGGRGIKVCKEWAESFEKFAADVGEPPSRKHSIERIDNQGNYEPGNCRWATKTEQARNRRTSHFIVINGEKHCLSEWLEIKGLNKSTFEGRIRRGWTEQDAISKAA